MFRTSVKDVMKLGVFTRFRVLLGVCTVGTHTVPIRNHACRKALRLPTSHNQNELVVSVSDCRSLLIYWLAVERARRLCKWLPIVVDLLTSCSRRLLLLEQNVCYWSIGYEECTTSDNSWAIEHKRIVIIMIYNFLNYVLSALWYYGAGKSHELWKKQLMTDLVSLKNIRPTSFCFVIRKATRVCTKQKFGLYNVWVKTGTFCSSRKDKVAWLCECWRYHVMLSL